MSHFVLRHNRQTSGGMLLTRTSHLCSTEDHGGRSRRPVTLAASGYSSLRLGCTMNWLLGFPPWPRFRPFYQLPARTFHQQQRREIRFLSFVILSGIFGVSVFATSSNCLRNLFIAHTVVVGARLTKAEAEALRRWVVLAGRALPVPPNGTLEIPGGTTHLNLGPPALPIQFLGCSS